MQKKDRKIKETIKKEESERNYAKKTSKFAQKVGIKAKTWSDPYF